MRKEDEGAVDVGVLKSSMTSLPLKEWRTFEFDDVF